jgi:hypothetical protein
MPPGAGLGTLISLLLSIPFVMARDLGQLLLWLNRRRMMRAGLPPPLLNRSRAVAATFALASVIDVARRLPLLTGRSFSELIADFLHAPHILSPTLAVLVGALALSLLFLIVGLRGARGAPTDVIAALSALTIALSCAAALGGQLYLPETVGEIEIARYGNPLLHALYIATLSAALMRAWLSAPLIFGGNALRMINRLIRRRNAPLRAARPGHRRGLALALVAGGAALALVALVLL